MSFVPRTSAALLFLLGSTAPVGAQETPAQALSRLRELVLYASFADAIQEGRTFLARTDLSARDRNLGYEVIAIAQIADRQRPEANQTLRDLYRRDPGHVLQDRDASPTVREAFEAAQRGARRPLPVQLDHTHQSQYLTRIEPTFAVRVTEHGDAVALVRFHVRGAGQSSYETHEVEFDPAASAATAEVPHLDESGGSYAVEYYIEALAPSGTALGTVGSADEPLQVVIPASDGSTATPADGDGSGGKSIAKQWWFWTAIGAVVVGGTVGAIMLTGGESPPPGGTLGSVRLRR